MFSRRLGVGPKAAELGKVVEVDKDSAREHNLMDLVRARVRGCHGESWDCNRRTLCCVYVCNYVVFTCRSTYWIVELCTLCVYGTSIIGASLTADDVVRGVLCV